MWLALLAVLPLCLDTFAVSAALGARRPARRRRLLLSGVFVVFEAGMPALGLAVGTVAARRWESVTGWLAAGLLIAVGLWLLIGGEQAEERAAARLSAAALPGMLLAGLAVSLDELAIGVTLGLAGAGTLALVLLIAGQALLASQLGLALGARVAERWREGAERATGGLLILYGVALVGVRLLG